MDAKTKELARQAGFDIEDSAGDGEIWFDEGWCTSLVERFAALIRHDEAKACAEHYLPIMRDAVEQAVLKEREACAKLCGEKLMQTPYGEVVSAAIRARSTT